MKDCRSPLNLFNGGVATGMFRIFVIGFFWNWGMKLFKNDKAIFGVPSSRSIASICLNPESVVGIAYCISFSLFWNGPPDDIVLERPARRQFFFIQHGMYPSFRIHGGISCYFAQRVSGPSSLSTPARFLALCALLLQPVKSCICSDTWDQILDYAKQFDNIIDQLVDTYYDLRLFSDEPISLADIPSDLPSLTASHMMQLARVQILWRQMVDLIFLQ